LDGFWLGLQNRDEKQQDAVLMLGPDYVPLELTATTRQLQLLLLVYVARF
jgi:hypothetical protein